MTAVLQSAIIVIRKRGNKMLGIKKRQYKVTFTTGFTMILLLSQFDLKKLIHQYKVRGYEPLAI